MNSIDVFRQNLRAANFRPNTIDTYAKAVAQAEAYIAENYGLRFTDEELNNVTGQMIKDWVASLETLFLATRNLYTKAMRSFIRDMGSSGYFEKYSEDIVPKIRQSKDDEDIDDEDDSEALKEYSPDEVYALINAPCRFKGQECRDKAILALLFGTGLRCFELCSLTVGVYRGMRSGKIRVVRKGGKKCWVSVADYVIPYIEDYLNTRTDSLQDDSPLFATRTGTGLTPGNMYKVLKTKQVALGLKTGVHNTRHTFLSDINRRATPSVARDAGGHSSIQITNTYIHNRAGDVRSAIDTSPWGEMMKKEHEDI